MIHRATAVRRILGEDEDESPGGILGFVLSRGIIDLTFTAAAAVSIAAAAYIESDWSTSERLRKVTIILYLEITIALSIHAVFLVYKESKALSESLSTSANSQLALLNVFAESLGLGLRERAPAGQTYVVYLHCPILFLLLIRQAYLLATFNTNRRNEESLWYPLFAMPEFLAACLFSVRGLVPRPEDLPEEDEKRSYWSKLWRAYNTRT